VTTLLDTSVYGVLADPGEEDYDAVRRLIDFAKGSRGDFVTTCIVIKEVMSEDMPKRIGDIILPDYFSTISGDKAPLEICFSEEYEKSRKLAWTYIQDLEKKEAEEVMDDALNYAYCSIANVDVFVTRNRRGILAREYHDILRNSNQKHGLGFVRIMTPSEFLDAIL